MLTTVKENTVNHAGNIAVDLPSSDDDDGSFTVGLQTDCPNEAESLTVLYQTSSIQHQLQAKMSKLKEK